MNGQLSRATRPIRSLLAVLAVLAGFLAAGFALAGPAAATARNGVCESGEFCYYYNSNLAGAVSDFTGSLDNYGTTEPSCYDFKGTAAGHGTCIKNNAASARNLSSYTVRVYYNSYYGGAYQDFAPGSAGNLVSPLYNENASHQFLSPTPPPSGSLGTKIVTTATNELNNSAHNHEIGGYNCNYYTTSFGAGSASCSNGWRSEEWCADFARWVWGHSGANTSGLTAAAASFYQYGKAHGTWHTSSPHVGDAVVFNLSSSGTYASHVGLVVQTSPTLMISGNSYGGDSSADRVSRGSLDSGIAGYATPVA